MRLTKAISFLDRPAATLVLVAVAVATIIAIDTTATPNNSVAVLYALPMLIAAHRLPPPSLALITGLSLLVYPVFAVSQGMPMAVIGVALLTLAAIGFLTFLLAHRLREAEAARQAAEEAEALLQRFLGMVAHDIRGPLTTIKMNVQFLASNADADSRPVDLLNREVARLERLATDLLDAARIGTGRFQIRPKATDLTREVKQAVQTQLAAAPGHQIELEAGGPIVGNWDADRLAQLLQNLLTNAVRYSPGKEPIRVHMAMRDGLIVVEVHDRGIGIPPEKLPLLFQPFSRLHGGQGISGTGLGLYIARAIVAAHGGDIWAASEGAGKGTTVTFTLPPPPAVPKPVPAVISTS